MLTSLYVKLGLYIAKRQHPGFLRQEADIRVWLTEHATVIGDLTISPSGEIEVDGDVTIQFGTDDYLPVSFKTVSGTFKVLHSSLKSLIGAPATVGDFECQVCDALTTLIGGPTTVNGSYNCSQNPKLTTLLGVPHHIPGDFLCFQCPALTSLRGVDFVGGDFTCNNCNNLVSLEGGPATVGGQYSCTSCGLTTLRGVPREINGSFFCSRTEITSLEGGPDIVHGSFYCNMTQLINCKGAPRLINDKAVICTDGYGTKLDGMPPTHCIKTDIRHQPDPTTLQQLLIHKTTIEFQDIWIPIPAWITMLNDYHATGDLLAAIACFEKCTGVTFYQHLGQPDLPALPAL